MSVNANKQQLATLVDLMCGNPNIAKGFHKEKKETVADFWKNLETHLNSQGPPLKSVAEWKKVWVDQKRYVKKKAIQNMQNRRKTGGGPNKEYRFSATEEAIYSLLSLDESVEGVKEAQVFGLQKTCDKRNAEQLIDIAVDKDDTPANLNTKQPCKKTKTNTTGSLMDELETQKSPSSHLYETMDDENIPANSNIKQPCKKSKKTTTDLLLDELETQKNLNRHFGEAIEIFKEHNKEIEHRFREISTTLMEIREGQNKLLVETIRHNKAMEKMREIEFKNNLELLQRQIQLEELKTKQFDRNYGL